MPDAAKPRGKFRGVADTIRERITSGAWLPGAPMPSEAELMAEFGIARGTVRAALLELKAAGLIRVVPGKGRVVCDTKGAASALLSVEELVERLRERLRAGGFEVGASFLSESDVARDFGVTRHAARRALGVLEASGILTSTQGRRRAVARSLKDSDGS